MTQKPRFDVSEPKVPFKEDVILEEDHRHGNIVRHPPELLDRILLLVGEGISGVESDLEVEDGIRELRLPRRRIWTVENFAWHVDVEVVGRGGDVWRKGVLSRPLYDLE